MRWYVFHNQLHADAALMPRLIIIDGLSEALIDRTTGTNIGNMTALGGLAASFNGTTSETTTNASGISASPGYVGKTYGAGKIFSRAVVYGSSNAGFINGTNPSTTLTIYGKNGTPASATDGTSIGSVTFTDTTNESAGRSVTSTDTTNTYTSIWVYVNGGAVSCNCAELEMYELI